jgi:hypothetical protein
VDWDWEDGPPQQTPRGAPREQQPRPPEEPPLQDPGTPSFSDAIDRFEEPPRYDTPDADAAEPDYDDARTQFIRLPADSGIPATSGAPARPGTAVPAPDEAAGPPAVRGPQRADRRPRTPDERAARRALRRKQIRRRRLVALAIIVVILILIVVLIVRGCGGPAAVTAAFLVTPIVLRPRSLARQPQRATTAADGARPPASPGWL